MSKIIKYKKIVLVALLYFVFTISYAQITKANLQASGLTCSMCNLTIKKSLEKISSIDSVIPDVETATYELKFKKNAVINFNEIKNAVTNAGFSVAKLVFSIDTQKVKVNSDKKFEINGFVYTIIDGKMDSKNATTEFQIVDKTFVSDKVFKKKYKKKIKATENVFHLVQIKN